jgi:hypothetical protein
VRSNAGFMYAAYAVAVVAYGLYAISLYLRGRRLRRGPDAR